MADKTLDELIQERKMRFGKQQGVKTSDGGGKNWTSGKGRLTNPGYSDRTTMQEGTGDVRNKIIQNKRLRMKDARDRLAELAKQGDARDRINKMRKKTPLLKTPPAKIPMKTVHNENKPSNFEGKTHMKGSSLIRTVAGEMNGAKPGPQALRQPPAKPQPALKRSAMGSRYHPIPSNPNVVTIKNDKAAEMQNSVPQNLNSFRGQMRTLPVKQAPRPPMPRNTGVASYPMRRGEMSGMYSAGMLQARPPQPLMQNLMSPADIEVVRPTRLEITASNTHRVGPGYSDEWDFPARPPPPRPAAQRPLPPRLPDAAPQRQPVRMPVKKRPIYEEKPMEQMRPPKKIAAISTGLMARLDQAQQPRQLQGTRVIVTNLHPCVSVEDMEELFGTIGAILSARMVREGVAEAIFMNEDDAHKSVEVFHNRQLDGQPMCVSVVSRKAPLLPASSLHTSKAQTKSILKAASVGRSSSEMRQAPGNPGVRKNVPVTPDLGAIHEALFTRSQYPVSDQVFLVKLPKPFGKKQ